MGLERRIPALSNDTPGKRASRPFLVHHVRKTTRSQRPVRESLPVLLRVVLPNRPLSGSPILAWVAPPC
jgi:hypothetical protein